MDILEASKTNKIVECINKNICLFDPFERVYIFGSALNKPNPNDADILVVFEKFKSDTNNKINTIKNTLENILCLPIHITALSTEEEKDTSFIEKITPNYIMIK